MISRCDPVPSLSASERSACLALLRCHFSGVDAAGFSADLADKTHIIRCFDQDHLVGFTTLALRRHDDWSEPILELYSGDTIMDPSAWSAAALAPAWFEACWGLTAAHNLPTVWLLICSGVRTYRLLTLFWNHYVPSSDGDDAQLLQLRDHLATRRFGRNYDKGIVRLPCPQRLRSHLAAIPQHYVSDPHSQLFLAANPGHQRGDELACVCPFTLDNLSRAGRRVATQVGILPAAEQPA